MAANEAQELVRRRLLELSGQPPLTDDQRVALLVAAGGLARVLGVDEHALGEALCDLAECWPAR